MSEGPASDSAGPPESADVVVIGGGIVGCATAYFLAKRGVSVALCEKGRIGAEQSGRNWGFVRQQGRDPAEMPMMIESLRIWAGLGEAIGEDVGFARGGSLYLARDAKELDELAAWLPVAEAHQLDTRVLDRAGVDRLIGGAEGRWAGALYTASDGRAEPALAAPALGRAAGRAGAAVLTRCAVRTLETSAGRVSAAVTERGTIRTSRVVCAAGAWTRLFSGNLGVTVPQLKLRGTVARTAPVPRFTECNAWSMPVAVRPRADGGYTVAHGSASEHSITPDTLRFFRLFLQGLRAERGKLRLRLGKPFLTELAAPKRWRGDEVSPFERTRVLDPAPDRRLLRRIREGLRRWYPPLAEVPFVETWAGMIEAAPDALPMIEEVSALPGYIVASGFSGHGFGLGPGAGRVLADLAMARDPGHDLAPFALSRFALG